MRELPVLFNSQMVRKIISRQKTQTRRAVKDPQSVRFDKNPFFADQLYVRESFCRHYFDTNADAFKADWDGKSADGIPEPRWTPSIHMPRSASRLILRPSSVALERLQDITEEDSVQEGIDIHSIDDDAMPYLYSSGLPQCLARETAKEAFRDLWIGIYGLESWDSNPYVWVCKFEVIL